MDLTQSVTNVRQLSTVARKPRKEDFKKATYSTLTKREDFPLALSPFTMEDADVKLTRVSAHAYFTLRDSPVKINALCRLLSVIVFYTHA